MEKLTSRRNPTSIHIKKLGNSKAYRDECGQYVCDGKKLLDEAIVANADIVTILTSKSLPQGVPDGSHVYNADEDLLESLSPLKTPQGLLFVCRMKEVSDIDYTTGTHILLDNIQDPGNVGTIIRSSNAFGIDSVILTEDSADIYNPKSVRASMGAIFKQQIVRKSRSEILEFQKMGVKIIGTSNDDSAVDVRQFDFSNVIIVLGNEGKGISEDLLELCDEVVRIPLAPDCESLNVSIAASILMWEASKQDAFVQEGSTKCHR
jgi:TrmH family RNA methyltransferase